MLKSPSRVVDLHLLPVEKMLIGSK